MTVSAKSAVRAVVHAALSPVEERLLASPIARPNWPHIFILGAPRSGTSLFYELLVTSYRFAYFSNLAHRFWKTPVAASRIGKKLILSHKATYHSDYGHISGWAAPNEGGAIWRRWLNDGGWADETYLPGLQEQEMRSTLGAMSGIFGVPFVNKNVMHSNRMRLLDALFPGCLFIEVRRDPVETARSILRAQQRKKGPAAGPDEWWSVRPSTAAGEDPIERACNQVVGVAEDIRRDSHHIGRTRLHVVDYASLCNNPRSTLELLDKFMTKQNVPMYSRCRIPEAFSPSKPANLTDEVEARLQDTIGNYTYED